MNRPVGADARSARQLHSPAPDGHDPARTAQAFPDALQPGGPPSGDAAAQAGPPVRVGIGTPTITPAGPSPAGVAQAASIEPLAAAPGDGPGYAEAATGLPTDTTAVAEVLDRAVGRGLEAYGRAPGADPAAQLAPRIAQAMFARHQMVSVQLHPLELGSVQIRIVVDPNRKVRAVLHAEHPETLDLLQRHAVGLERALTATGLGLAESDALTFDLGTPQDGQTGQNGDGRSDREQRGVFPAAELLPTAFAAPLRSAATGLLDLVL